MTKIDDHFSPLARAYARGRFGYPPALYQFLAAHCPAPDRAWDCGTGSGQAALDLTREFSNVIATDISLPLLQLAPAHPRIDYRAVSAEASGLPAASMDLVTVAQALHWFDLPRFWRETARVLKPGGLLAFWGYTWPLASPAIDGVLAEFRTVIAPHWPAKSELLQEEYRTVTPPFPEIECPHFVAEVDWMLEDYLAHWHSWSAVRYHREQFQFDLVARFAPRLQAAWPASGTMRVTWPLHLRVFRVG